MMRERFIIIFILLAIFVGYLSFISCGQSSSTVTTTSSTTTTTLSVDDVLANMSFASLEVFPIDLNNYFSTIDLEVGQTSILGGYAAMITPFLLHTGNHPEGTGKWYVYGQGTAFSVYCPGLALVKRSEVEESLSGSGVSRSSIGTQEIYSNKSINLYFDGDKVMNLGHIDILKSLFDAIAATSENCVFIPAGQHLGYTSSGTALDIQMNDEGVSNGLAQEGTFGEHLVSPLPYFNSSIQEEFTNYYDTYIYSKMLEGGKWPEPALSCDYNISIDETVWSTWYHKSGLSPTASDGFWYFFPYGILSFIHHIRTNPDTFFANPVLGTLISQESFDWVGLYVDYHGIGDANAGDTRFVEVLTGDGSSEGICRMRPYISPSEESSFKYIRFTVDPKTSAYWDDELRIKFFDTSTEALADSFADPVVYVRDNELGTPLAD